MFSSFIEVAVELYECTMSKFLSQFTQLESNATKQAHNPIHND